MSLHGCIARVTTLCRCVWLGLRNLLGGSRVTHPGGPVLSLTSYGNRLRWVFLTIESITRGSLLPSRIILWVDEESVVRHPPASLRRLMRRGLEILPCEDYGPHKKYFPYVASQDCFQLPLVTADDDVLYPKFWLSELVDAHLRNPQSISCFRARVVALRGESQLAGYGSWKLCRSTVPKFEHVAIGTSGILYPAQFLKKLKEAGPGFIRCCPRADDIWLHLQAIRAGLPIAQVRTDPLLFPPVPRSQKRALWKTNMAGRNDVQIQASYTPSDIALLRASLEREYIRLQRTV